ncbi:MAG TPA: ATP-binding protein [Nocardioidaceae bacterium]|nr:ATP-binding protein [Nocardioidaceae bacterium]
MAGEYHVEGLAVPESLDLLHALLDRVRNEHGEIDPTELMLFETAIIEIHGNVVQHGRPEGQVLYTFDLEVSEVMLVGVLADNGEAVPDLSGQEGLVGEDAESGRGLGLARAALDELGFVRRDHQNTWRMVKKRTA